MAGALTASGKAVSRDIAIDVARGIAIVCVVIGHNPALAGAAPAFVDALFLFHVPLFFLLSGRVQPARPMNVVFINLARRLLLPFLLAAFVVGGLKLMTRGGSVAPGLLGIAWGTGQTLPWSHLWFLPALFLALLSSAAVRTLPGGSARWAWTAAMMLLLVLSLPMAVGPDLSTLGFAAPAGWPWSVDLLPVCLLFVCLGALLQESPAVRRFVEQPLVVAAAVVVFALGLGALVDLNLRIFTPPALALLAAASGCVMALALARALAAVRPVAAVFATVGRHTLAIFLLHVSLQKALLGFMAAPSSTFARALAGLATVAAAILMSVAVSAGWDWLLSHRRARRMALPAREIAT